MRAMTIQLPASSILFASYSFFMPSPPQSLVSLALVQNKDSYLNKSELASERSCLHTLQHDHSKLPARTNHHSGLIQHNYIRNDRYDTQSTRLTLTLGLSREPHISAPPIKHITNLKISRHYFQRLELPQATKRHIKPSAFNRLPNNKPEIFISQPLPSQASV